LLLILERGRSEAMELVKMFLLMALMVTIAAAYHHNGPRETGDKL
jgi:hypothetical protein